MITEQTAVSLKRAMKSLVTAGMTRRTACQDRCVERANQRRVVATRQDHIIAWRDGISQTAQTPETSFVERDDRQVLQRGVDSVNPQLRRPHPVRVAVKQHRFSRRGKAAPQKRLGRRTAQHGHAMLPFRCPLQIIPLREARIALPHQHLELIHVVGDGCAVALGPRLLPLVAVEHDVNVATLQQIRQLVPLTLCKARRHPQPLSQQGRQFDFEALDLRRIIVARIDVRAPPFSISTPDEHAALTNR